MIIYEFLVVFVLVPILVHPKINLLQKPFGLFFLGYALNHKAYELYDPHFHTIFISRDVMFHENVFLIQSMTIDF